MAWAEFKDKTKDINDPNNYIQGSLQADKPDSNQIGDYWLLNHPNWLWVDDAWIPPMSLSQLKSNLTATINLKCQLVITGGFTSSALGTPHRYDSDIVDQINFMQAYTIAKVTGLPVSYRIWNEDGTKEFHDHTAAQFEVAYQDGAVVKALALQKCAELKASIDNATTAEELEIIKW